MARAMLSIDMPRWRATAESVKPHAYVPKARSQRFYF
jgi:hypothetical protein